MFSRIPVTMRVGFAITGAGATLDVVYHALPVQHVLGDAGHVVTLVGMLLTFVGVFGAAFPRRTALDPRKGETK